MIATTSSLQLTFLIYRKMGSQGGGLLAPHQGPRCPLQRETRTPALNRSRLMPRHPGDSCPELEVQSQDDLIYRKDKDVV